MLVMVVIALLITAGVVWWWRRRNRSITRLINTLLITEDRRIVLYRFPVELGYCIMKEWRQAWIIDHECILRHAEDLSPYILAEERDALSLPISGAVAKLRSKYQNTRSGTELPEIICSIAAQTMKSAIAKNTEGDTNEQKNGKYNTIILILAGAFSILAILAMLSGRFL